MDGCVFLNVECWTKTHSIDAYGLVNITRDHVILVISMVIAFCRTLEASWVLSTSGIVCSRQLENGQYSLGCSVSLMDSSYWWSLPRDSTRQRQECILQENGDWNAQFKRSCLKNIK